MREYRGLVWAFCMCAWLCSASNLSLAQALEQPDAATPLDAGHPVEDAVDDADAGVAETGEVPVTPEEVINPGSTQEPPEAPPVASKPAPGPCGDAPCTEFRSEAQHSAPSAGMALIVWASAGWSEALGPARCGPTGLEGSDFALRIASTLKHSVAAAGIGIAAAGALGDHPLIAYAAEHSPQLLAALLAEAGFSALAVGIADLNGPLLRSPVLANELSKRGISIVATNLVCAGQSFCSSWLTAEDPVPIIERAGRRYAFIAFLPDDTLARVEPALGRSFQLQPAAAALLARTSEARLAGADLTIASVDHGPDPSAAASIADFVAELPEGNRTDLLLHPNSSDRLLFLRPLEVRPAIVGARAGALTALRVTKLPDSDDADVFARSLRLGNPDPSLQAQLAKLGVDYCREQGKPLPGGTLAHGLDDAALVELAAGAARALAGTDLAVVDPKVFDASFAQPRATRLQRGQCRRTVMLDAPLVFANVPLEWLDRLHKLLDGIRPLTLIGTGDDGSGPLIAGRAPVPGALYSVVTTSVLARSGRLPDGVNWSALEGPNATLRGALLAHLDAADPRDPRSRLRDPRDGTQWIFRADGQVQGSLTAVDNRGMYVDEPALKVNKSQQLGVRLLLNLDADAPGFLFENALQLAFDRNFVTKNTAQDLAFLQTTYTYRGLWPDPLLYPHPFVEGYFETEFDRGTAAYRHMLLRPKAGLRSVFSRVFSLKLSAGFQYEALMPDAKIFPGLGAELLLKPWQVALTGGMLQLEGNLVYYWNSPGHLDQHTLRAQLIAGLQLIGPLQFTLSALASIRKDRHAPLGEGLGIQAGIRLRFIDRLLQD